MTLKSTNPLTHSSEEIQYLRKGIFQFFHFKGFPTLELISRRPNLLHTYTVLCINWFWSFRWSYSRNKSFAYWPESLASAEGKIVLSQVCGLIMEKPFVSDAPNSHMAIACINFLLCISDVVRSCEVLLEKKYSNTLDCFIY
jgi:hypothetical protein